MKELLAFLDKYGVKYTVDGESVIVSGNLWLSNNQLTALPDSFGNLKVGGNLYLHNNQLTALPESFGNLKVGGNLWLSNNQLTALPDSFGNLKVGGYLWLSNNQLTALPDSFGNLKVGGNLWLHNNQLTALPESFGSLKIGGDLWLDNNQLTSEPVFNRMAGNVVEKDWCYVDGIVREVVSRKNLGEGLTLIKTPFDYIVGNGEAWAHGKTTDEALEDYRFKLYKSDPEELKGLDLDKPLSHPEAINVYRAITGACREGVRRWMAGKDLPEPITIRQVLSLTSDAYGGSEFAGFFGGKIV